jgi:hypothetical protein
LSLPKPNLDDKTFSQLVEEAIKLIPKYAPEWTDHNASDPGITLVELFAWLTEIMLYRINLVTDEHRLKYLKLLGVRPTAPIPAKVDITFESGSETFLEKDKISLSALVYDEKIPFELDENINITNAKLEKIVVDELTGIYDRTNASAKEQKDLYFAPFGLNPQKECSLYLGFDKAPDKLSFMCYLYDKDLKGIGEHGNEIEHDFKNAKFKWQKSNEAGWKDVSYEKDGTKGFKKSGRFTFNKLNNDWGKTKIKGFDYELYWLRCVVEEYNMEYPPRIETIILNTVSATEGQTIKDEKIGKGDGLPYQTFTLKKNKPVLDKTLILKVDDKVDDMEWEEVDDFDGSKPEDKHFLLNREKGEISFGDGFHGCIPSVDSELSAVRYRIGGGKEGNIKSEESWDVIGNANCSTINYKPASGGSDVETIEEASLRLLRDMKVPYTAVTSEDFEYIAVNTPGLRVAKAKAITIQENKKKIAVDVVVIPYTFLESLDKPPDPSVGFVKAICDHLNKHRLLGTEIKVMGPLYVKVSVTLTVVASKGFNEESLRAKIIEAINNFLHPVKGGENGKGWIIGRNVYRSEIYKLIEEKIEGVECVVGVSLSGDNGSTIKDGNLILPSKTATIYPGKHTVIISREVELCRRKSYGT